LQHSGYKGDGWPGPDDFVRNCFGIEEELGRMVSKLGQRLLLRSGIPEAAFPAFGLDNQVHLGFIGGAIRSKNL